MITKKIRVYGIVQGVGFRPTVSRHATAAGITGSVCNKGPYVEIFAQGEEKCVKDFLEKLENQHKLRREELETQKKYNANRHGDLECFPIGPLHPVIRLRTVIESPDWLAAL